MEALQKFHQVVDNRHDYARSWKKRTGRKAIGYFSCYVPEEIIHAAGILPVRVMAARRGLDVTLQYMPPLWCAYSRGCLTEAVEGRYDYLDGVVQAHECTHYHGAFYSWQKHVPIAYTYDIYTPSHIQSRHAKDCIRGEIADFKRSLEEWLGQTISEEALDEAIKVYNTNRRLLRELYELGRSDNTPLSSVELMEATLASQFMDKEEHSALLQQVLDEASKRKGASNSRARLMLLGPEFDDIEFVRLVESLGGKIVINDLDTGTRYFWHDVPSGEDPLSAIATRLATKTPCPMKDVQERWRFDQVLKLAKDYGVQGAIFVQRQFCDAHGYDLPPLQSLLKENNIPSLVIEFATTVLERKARPQLIDFLEPLHPKA